MNIDSFYTYLEHPELLNQQTLAELKEINERYPYFQTSRVLFLKNLHLLNDYRYADELKKVSAYAANRQALYNLIHDEQLNKEISFQKKPIISELIEDKSKTVEEIKTESFVNESENSQEIKPVQDLKEDVIEEVFVQPVQEIKEETIITDKIPAPVVEENITIITEEKIVEKDIVSEISLPSEIDKNEEVQPETEIQVVEKLVDEKVPEPEVAFEKEVVEEEIKTEIKTEEKIVVEEPVKPVEVIITEVEKKTEEKPVSAEPLKESIADIILRKVAEIHQSRKEPYKPYVHPVVEKKKVEEEIPVKKEEIIVIPEPVKAVEEVSLIEEQVNDVPEKLDFEITEEIQEIVEPISEETIPCIEIEHFDNVEIEDVIPEVVSELVEVEPEKSEELVVEQKVEEVVIPPVEIHEFEEPIFTPPVYDISLLLKEMPEEIKPEESKDVSVLSMSFSQWLNFMSEEPKPARKKSDTPDLIDSFLSNSPRMNLQETGKELAEQENQPPTDDDYVSEALADILLSQGHTNQAFNMYEKLALKYPEKNAYFADRILKIKKLNNNQ